MSAGKLAKLFTLSVFYFFVKWMMNGKMNGHAIYWMSYTFETYQNIGDEGSLIIIANILH